MHLRLATTADARPLHQACYPDQPWPQFEPAFRRALQRQEAGHGRYLLAFTEPETTPTNLIGTAQLLHTPTYSEIADIFVVRAWRRQGVATTLITHLEQQAAELGWFPLEIGVETANEPALALYQQLGYAIDRPLRLLNGRPALILRKENEHYTV